jgi:hypothetical protein
MERPLPQTPDDWLDEICLAFDDVRGVIPFAENPGRRVGEGDLFHLALIVCLKFRGLDYRDEELREQVTRAALATYVVNSDREDLGTALQGRPRLAFGLCYVAAHLALDLLDEEQANAVLCHCEEHLDEGKRQWKRKSGDGSP